MDWFPSPIFVKAKMKTKKTNVRTVIAFAMCVMMLFAFCACGSKSKISKKLIGKAKVNADNINSELFTKIDIRQTTRIQVDSDKPTIKSQHPSDSYRIIPNKKNNTAEIQIVDETDFWSLTRYLIIQK